MNASLHDPTPLAETTTVLVERLVKGYVRPYSGRLFFAILCMILAAAATAANAWIMQPILDDVFLNRDSTMLILVPIAVLIIAFVKGLASKIASRQLFFCRRRSQIMERLARNAMRYPPCWAGCI